MELSNTSALNMVASSLSDDEEEERPINRTAPAGRLVAPEEVARDIRDSIARGTNPNIDTAARYLLLAAINICEDSTRSFAYYLSHPDPEEAEYLAMEGKRSNDQVRRVLEVMKELEGLDVG